MWKQNCLETSNMYVEKLLKIEEMNGVVELFE